MEESRIIKLFQDIKEFYPTLNDLANEMMLYPQYPEDVYHIFAGGVYIRELHIPEGALIIGKRHRGKTCNILMEGEMYVYDESDGSANKIKAPLIFESQPLSKKMAYCTKKCIFMNIHPTEENDLKKIEGIFIIPEEEFKLLEKGDNKCLGEWS